MAIPSIPQNLTVQQANAKVLVSWQLSAGATSYKVQRSLDNVTFTDLVTVSGVPLATEYLDSAVDTGVQYWYRVSASNTDGDSPYTLSDSAIPALTAEMSLKELRQRVRERADRVNSQFVTDPELNKFINLAAYELYDLLITTYADFYVAEPIQFLANGSQFSFPLPNGKAEYVNPDTNQTIVAKSFYKLLGVDLALNTAANAYVTVNSYNFIDRNRFVYPNTASTIYGVFNLQYRLMGNTLRFIPTPSGGQKLRVWYIPRLTELLQDTDLTDISISGWIEYVIVRAAKYILDKEESDTQKLDEEILFLKQRIEDSAQNRDAGQGDKISNTRSGGWGNGWFSGNNGSNGGW